MAKQQISEFQSTIDSTADAIAMAFRAYGLSSNYMLATVVSIEHVLNQLSQSGKFDIMEKLILANDSPMSFCQLKELKGILHYVNLIIENAIKKRNKKDHAREFYICLVKLRFKYYKNTLGMIGNRNADTEIEKTKIYFNELLHYINQSGHFADDGDLAEYLSNLTRDVLQGKVIKNISFLEKKLQLK